MNSSLRPGDRVRFLNEIGEGTVIQVISADQALIEDSEGFEYPYALNELVKIENSSAEAAAYRQREPNPSEVLIRNTDPNKLKQARKGFKEKYKEREDGPVRYKGDVVEVDLHVHELLDSQAGLSPSDMREIQMAHFERMMNRAEHEHIGRLVFIHGVGEGVLRAEIRKHLELYYPKAEYFDASYADYGYGATEVRLRFN